MAVELTPLGKVVVGTFKWIMVPMAAAFIGYVLLGPNIGKEVAQSVRRVPGIGSMMGNKNAPKTEKKQPEKTKSKGDQFRDIRNESAR